MIFGDFIGCKYQNDEDVIDGDLSKEEWYFREFDQ